MKNKKFMKRLLVLLLVFSMTFTSVDLGVFTSYAAEMSAEESTEPETEVSMETMPEIGTEQKTEESTEALTDELTESTPETETETTTENDTEQETEEFTEGFTEESTIEAEVEPETEPECEVSTELEEGEQTDSFLGMLGLIAPEPKASIQYVGTYSHSVLHGSIGSSTLGWTGRIQHWKIDGNPAVCIQKGVSTPPIGTEYNRYDATNLPEDVRRAVAWFESSSQDTLRTLAAQYFAWAVIDGKDPLAVVTEAVTDYYTKTGDDEALSWAVDIAKSYISAIRRTNPADCFEWKLDNFQILITSIRVTGHPKTNPPIDPTDPNPTNPTDPTPPPTEPEVEPAYDTVSASASSSADRSHSVSIDSKYAAITGESLAGAVFEVFEDGNSKGTITTGADGRGSISWSVGGSGNASAERTYCSNYDQLSDAKKATVTGFTNREDAYNDALAEAQRNAQAQADAGANASHSVTIKEMNVPNGFYATSESEQNASLSGDASHSFSVKNQPWKAKLTLDKVDGIIGSQLEEDAAFTLYEWDGAKYIVSSNYTIIRLEDGMYTVTSKYADGQQGYLYYTQKNQGKFGVGEASAPAGYNKDEEIYYFQITKDNQEITVHNVHPENYLINNPAKFANEPWKAKLTLDKVDGISGSRLTKDAEFIIYEWNGKEYAPSPDYDMIRLEDGTYTAKCKYPNTEQGYIFYSQYNEGKFGVGEKTAPDGYLKDEEIFYFRITEDNQTFAAHNAHPENYEMNDSTKWADQPAHVYIEIPKIDRYSGNRIVSDAEFVVYTKDGGFTRPVTFAKQADGSYLSNEIYYADTFDNANFGLFYVVEQTAPDGFYGDWADENADKTAGSKENKVVYEFYVSGNLSNHDTVITITNDGTGGVFWNEHQYGSVSLHKYDDEAEADDENGSRITQGDTTTLDGAVYGLYAEEDIYHPDGVTGLLYHKDDLVATAAVGETPIADSFGYLLDADGNRCIVSGKEPAVTETPGSTGFAQVELGHYYISEITPPEGYLPDTTEHRGDVLTKYYVSFEYDGEAKAVIVRKETAGDDGNDLTMDDAIDSPDIYSGDFVFKQAAQFVKLEDSNTDTEKDPVQAGFSIYRIGALAGVISGSIAPDGDVWTRADMVKLKDYDFSAEQTALLYKRNSETWTEADKEWLVPTGDRANEYRVGEMFSDENGYFCTPELPTGQYVLVETTVPEGKKMADPVLVTVTKDSAAAQPMRYIGDETTETYIRIQKKDSDCVDGEWNTVLKPGAGYRIRLLSSRSDFDTEMWNVDADGYLWYYSPSMDVKHGTADAPFAVKCIYKNGKIIDAYIELDQLLPIGEYEVTETGAPDGFVINGSEEVLVDTSTDTENAYEIQSAPWEKVTFEISNDVVYPDGQIGENKYANTDEYGRLVITITQENKEQKGIIEISKLGEQLYDSSAAGKKLSDKLEKEPFRSIMQDKAYNTADQVFDYELAPVAGAVFEIYAAEDIYTQQLEKELLGQYADDLSHYLVHHKDDLIGTITTGDDGFAYLADLHIGKYYIKEVVAGDGFVLNTFLDEFEVTSAEPKVNFTVYESAYENERQKVDVTVTKRDADTNEWVAGAVYGLYNTEDIISYIKQDADGNYVINKAGRRLLDADTLIATAVTDEDGQAHFDADLPLAEYYVVELEAPVGYTNIQPVDRIDVNAVYAGQEVETILVNEENGGLVFTNQKTKHVFTKSDFTSGALLDNAVMQVVEIAVDENGNPRKEDGKYVTTLVEEWTSDREEVHYFYQDDNGFWMELESAEELPEEKELITKQGHLIEGLQEGREYIFREITAPHGYVGYDWSDKEVREANREENLAVEEVRFTVQDCNVAAEHDMKDQRVVGSILITKEGEFLDSAKVSFFDQVKNFFKTIFEYVTGKVSNAVFEVYVREDIYTPDDTETIAAYDNGTELIELTKDMLVATITTNRNGIAKLEGLPLGTYYIVEVGAGDGEFVLNETIADVTLGYEGQEVPVVVNDSAGYVNERQKIDLEVVKKSHFDSEYAYLNTDETVPEEKEDFTIEGAVFGLFTKEDIYGYLVDSETGAVTENPAAVIKADTLLEQTVTDENGSAHFESDLPCGMYYVKEIAAPDGYHASEEVIEVDASYQGQEIKGMEISYDFYNEPVIVEIEKTDITTGEEVVGATLTVKDKDGNVVDEWVTDGTKHYIKHLLIGETYTLTEIVAPDGYQIAEDVTFVVMGVDATQKIQTVVMFDEPKEPETPKKPHEPEKPHEPDAPVEKIETPVQTGDTNMLFKGMTVAVFSLLLYLFLAAWMDKKERRKE